MPNNVFKDLQSQYAVLGYNPDTAAYEARVSQLAAFNLVSEKGTVQIQPQNDYYPFQFLTVDADGLGVQLSNANGELRLQSQGGLLTLDTSGALIANGGTWSVDYTGRAAFYTATVTGAVTAASFAGDGRNLTGWMLGASQVGFVDADELLASNTITRQASAKAKLTLAPGTYFIETYAVLSSSAYATAGTRENLSFTGSATGIGRIEQASFASTDPNGPPPYVMQKSYSLLSEYGDVGYSLVVKRYGRLVVTAQGDIAISAAQYTAVAGTVSLLAGSFIKATRLS